MFHITQFQVPGLILSSGDCVAFQCMFCAASCLIQPVFAGDAMFSHY